MKQFTQVPEGQFTMRQFTQVPEEQFTVRQFTGIPEESGATEHASAGPVRAYVETTRPGTCSASAQHALLTQ